jgi:predicted RNase H-like nuclease
MTRQDADSWLAGVDGCRGGWIAVFGRPDGEVKPPRLFARFSDIILADEKPAIIAIDVPIGLPARSTDKGRLAENAVRPLLGDRKSSVFRIPSRRAVEASVAAEPADNRVRFFAACEIARQTSDDGKAFAKQSFYILDKVAEVDAFLRANPDDVRRVFETHPELAFVRMNGDTPLGEPKKLKSKVYPPGLELRRGLLRRAGIPDHIVGVKPLKAAGQSAGADDLIDALACLVTARRIHAGLARCHPDPAPRDEYDLPMAIWA